MGCQPCRSGEQPVAPGEDSSARPVPAPGPLLRAPLRAQAWCRCCSRAFLEEDDLFLYLKQVMFMQRHLNDSRSEGQI